ncbi:MarR family winged helix-turn-helix transcriptional regulator [uncultured Anaerofustis sp.]|uniref:MarR family winged helix-turn-helix transcriptional regulator n=1 Tax=uncultured Anaerofustis sp. TaxID=904996 RepID=UPI0025E4C569|nr:MarR family winged helix-turn-helix transcriptional regulator [uncultured Anaerofustis sp.]
MDNSKKYSCYCINFRRAANIVTKYYDNYLKEVGITINQFSLLKNILKIEPASVSEIAVKVGLERTTVVRNLKSLFKEQLIEDISDISERNKKVRLTEKGKTLLNSAVPLWENAQKDIENKIGKENFTNLLKTLDSLNKLDIDN